MRARIATAALALSAILPPPAQARQARPPRRPAVEVSAGIVAAGGTDFGRSSADLTGNEPSAPGVPLFRTDTTLAVATGADVRVAWLAGRTFAVEGSAAWLRQALESRITSDLEGAADVTVAQDLDTYLFEAAGVAHLNRLRFAGGRALPFVAAGAGYYRQLDEASRLVGSGPVYHAGGGVKYFPGRAGAAHRGLGVRADAGIALRSGGVELEEGRNRRASWRIGLGALWRF